MTIHEYLEECLLLLTVSPAVEHFSVTSRKETETDGYFRARAILGNECLLEISMYVQLVEDNTIRLMQYRYHLQDKEGGLIRRWDNARHFSALKSFPHHVHIGRRENAEESQEMALPDVLRLVESAMRDDSW